MRIRSFTAALVVLFTSLSVGCAGFDWRQSLYEIGDQHACQQHNEAKVGKAGATVECSNPDHPDRSRYRDYQQAKDAVTQSESPS